MKIKKQYLYSFIILILTYVLMNMYVKDPVWNKSSVYDNIVNKKAKLDQMDLIIANSSPTLLSSFEKEVLIYDSLKSAFNKTFNIIIDGYKANNLAFTHDEIKIFREEYVEWFNAFSDWEDENYKFINKLKQTEQD